METQETPWILITDQGLFLAGNESGRVGTIRGLQAHVIYELFERGW